MVEMSGISLQRLIVVSEVVACDVAVGRKSEEFMKKAVYGVSVKSELPTDCEHTQVSFYAGLYVKGKSKNSIAKRNGRGKGRRKRESV
jgi:hypothetical protein